MKKKIMLILVFIITFPFIRPYPSAYLQPGFNGKAPDWAAKQIGMMQEKGLISLKTAPFVRRVR